MARIFAPKKQIVVLEEEKKEERNEELKVRMSKGKKNWGNFDDA